MNIQRIRHDEIEIENNNSDPADRRKHTRPRLVVRTSIKAGGIIIHD